MSDKKIGETAKPEKHYVFAKLVLLLSVVAFSYFGFKYWQTQKDKAGFVPQNISDNGIFDLTDDAKNEDISDLTINEMKERGAEFVYQILLKNQVQIDALRTDVSMLKGEIIKYKNQEKIGKMILVYVDLRSKIFAGEKYENELKSFDILVASNSDLQSKVNGLKAQLPKFVTSEELLKNFRKLIPDLIVTKKYGDSDSVMTKIRRNISKLVVVRRIDVKNDSTDVDAIIVKIEKALQQENSAEALNLANSLDEKYKNILKKFLEDLSISSDVQKTDSDILNFLKSLT
jgi:hypothetical protein